MATRTLYIGNDWDIHRTGVTSRGTPVTGITARAFLSLTPNGDAIDPTLAIAALTEVTPGEFIGTLQGYDLSTVLLPLWEGAARNRLTVYERVIVDDEDYSDVAALTVERDRPPHEPDEDE